MFSGLVKGIGRVATRTDHGADRRFVLELGSAAVGAARRRRQHRRQRRMSYGGRVRRVTRFTADVSAATLAVTTLGRLAAGARVNLEPPLKAGDPLDGHIVTGHVDGVGEVVSVEPAGRSTRLVDCRSGGALALHCGEGLGSRGWRKPDRQCR